MKRAFIIGILFVCTPWMAWGGVTDSSRTRRKIPTGIRLGGILPAISYDSDVGFRYGLLSTFYDWGDGSTYPDYVRSLYLEASRTTKGSGQLMFSYDDRNFLSRKWRLAADGGYYVEQALDFYGFNGYQARYHPAWMNDKDSAYRTRMFYRIDRRMLRIGLNLRIPFRNNRLRGYGGLFAGRVRVGEVNIDRINKGKDPDEMLPSHDSVPGLYRLYRRWGLIDSAEATGGTILMIRGGAIYDTRDNEAWPNVGLWEEAFLIGALDAAHPSYRYIRLVATHRHYISLIERRLLFAYRLAASAVLAGKAPFYMLPFYHSTTYTLQDGFGGRRTVRGILRDRIVADGVAMGNFELRGRILNTRLLGQNFYIALNAFLDAARVLVPRPISPDSGRIVADGYNPDDFFLPAGAPEVRDLHLGVGAGIRFALNENFIVALDYGRPLNRQDGPGGLYINLGWLF